MSHDPILRLLRQSTGLDLSQADVHQAVKRRMRHCHIAQEQDYIARAVFDKEELGALIDLVVVPETWFFREAQAFSAACTLVRERLAEGRKPVRILSIPCATGEEPYSLAMTLVDAGIESQAFTIDAIDISRHAIAQARKGVYRRSSFRTKDLSFRDRHFIAEHDAYVLREEIRSLVSFEVGSVLTLDGKLNNVGRYDAVFCRNLLIYFDGPTQRNAIRKLQAVLRNDGFLFAGYAEAATFVQHGFAMLPIARAFALTKNERADAVPPASTSRPQQPPLPKTRRALQRHGPAFAQAVAQHPAAASTKAASDQRSQDKQQPLLESARRLADSGDIDGATKQFQAYLKYVPDSAEAYFMLGLLYEQRRQIDRAAQSLRRAVYLDPGHYDALCHLALLAEHGGDKELAGRLKHRAERLYRRQSGKSAK